LKKLKQNYPEWSPNAIVAIGANAGKWSKLARKSYPTTKLLMLEATPKHDSTLQNVSQSLGNAEHQIAVLSGRSGDTVEFFQGGNTGNSIFREDSRHYANQQPVQRTTVTLDDAIQQSHLLRNESFIDYVKADVQGAELLVLEGAKRTLAGASFVQLESGTTKYNTGGAACFWQVDAFLRENGFYWYDIDDLTRNPAFKTLGLGQFDILFVKPTSPRLPAKFRELNGTYCGMTQQQRGCQQEPFKNMYGMEKNIPDIKNVSGWWEGFVCGILTSAVGMVMVFWRSWRARSRKSNKYLL